MASLAHVSRSVEREELVLSCQLSRKDVLTPYSLPILFQVQDGGLVCLGLMPPDSADASLCGWGAG